MARILHLSYDVQGLLRWQDLSNIFIDENEQYVSHQEAKEYLKQLFQEGIQVIPLGDPCEGFDPINGCPGHHKPD